MPGLRTALEPVAVASAKFDLSLALAEQRAPDGAPAGIAGVLEYASDLFDAATRARRSASGSIRLLSAAVAEPDRAIGSLDILVGRRAPHHPAGLERHRARRSRTPPCRSCSPRRRRARRTRSRWCSSDATLSYRELDARANQLAHHLRALGVGPETIVGLCVERSLDMVVGLLGILKAGAAYLPLDPGLSGGAAAPSCWPTPARPCWSRSARCCDRLPARPRSRSSARRRPRASSRSNPPAPRSVASTRDTTAYVIYTSGSTGHPKGVAVTHRRLRQPYATRSRHDYPARRRMMSCLAAPRSAFDAADLGNLAAAAAPAPRSVVVPDATSPRSPASSPRSSRSAGITLIAVRALAARSGDGRSRAGALRNASTADLWRRSACRPSLGDGIAHDADGAPAGQLYGPTETTVHVSFVAARQLDDLPDQTQPRSDRPSDLEHAGVCAGRRSCSRCRLV